MNKRSVILIKNKYLQILSVTLIIFVGIIVMCSSDAYAGTDTTAPLINSLSFNKTHYEPGEPIEFTIDVTEEESGIESISFSLGRKTSPTTFVGKSLDKEYDSAVYSGKYTFSLNDYVEKSFCLPDGEYIIDYVYIRDAAGNQRDYHLILYDEPILTDCDPDGHKVDLLSGYQLSIGDTSVPLIYVKSVELLTDSVKRGEKIRVRLDLDNAVIGTKYTLCMAFTNEQYVMDADPVEFTYSGSSVICELPVSAYINLGKHKIYSLAVKSSSDTNYKQYSIIHQDPANLRYTEEDMCKILGDNAIYFKSSQGYDSPPVVSSISFDSTSIIRPGVLTARFNMGEDLTRVNQIDMWLSSQSGDYCCLMVNMLNQPENNKWNGVANFQIPSDTKPGKYFIKSISLLDSEGSTREYTTEYTNMNDYWIVTPDNNGDQYFKTYDVNGEEQIAYLFGHTGSVQYIEIKDEFDVAFESNLSDSNLVNKINNMQEGETARIIVNEKDKASEALFRAIMGKDKNLLFSYRSFQWIFNGKDITDPKDIDLKVQFYREGGGDYDTEGPVIIIKFEDNGELPGKANIRIKADYARELYALEGNMYLYYINEETNKLELENGSGIKLMLGDTDTWCSFEITHNSKFLATGTKIKNTALPLAKGKTFKNSKYKCTFKVTGIKEVTVSKLNYRSIKTVVIPAKVKYKGVTYKVVRINSKVFMNCKKLTKVTIGSNVKKIGSKAFSGCSKLSKVTIGTRVSQIGSRAFYNCPKLKTITIKTKLLKSANVGAKAFGKIHSKATIKVYKKNKKSYTAMLKKKGLTGKDQKVKTI